MGAISLGAGIALLVFGLINGVIGRSALGYECGSVFSKESFGWQVHELLIETRCEDALSVATAITWVLIIAGLVAIALGIYILVTADQKADAKEIERQLEDNEKMFQAGAIKEGTYNARKERLLSKLG